MNKLKINMYISFLSMGILGILYGMDFITSVHCIIWALVFIDSMWFAYLVNKMGDK